MSAYPGEDMVPRGLVSAGAPFVQKPLILEDLSRIIRELLDRARA